MALDDLSIAVTHRHTNNRRTRFFGNDKLGITSGREPCHVTEACEADISNINNRTVTIGKPDGTTIVNLDGVEKRNVPIFINALWWNDNFFTILVEYKALICRCKSSVPINQKRAISGVAYAAIVLICRDKHANTADGQIQ